MRAGLFVAPVPKTQPATPPDAATRSYQRIAFGHGRVHFDAELARRRVTVLGERAWRDADGRLCVELRLLNGPKDTPIDVLAYHADDSGAHRVPTEGLHQTLTAARPNTLTVTLPKTARSYELFIIVR